MITTSPAWTRRDRLARSPLTSTLPPSTACAAADLVLKKRAAHSHLSSRTRAAGADDTEGEAAEGSLTLAATWGQCSAALPSWHRAPRRQARGARAHHAHPAKR